MHRATPVSAAHVAFHRLFACVCFLRIDFCWLYTVRLQYSCVLLSVLPCGPPLTKHESRRMPSLYLPHIEKTDLVCSVAACTSPPKPRLSPTTSVCSFGGVHTVTISKHQLHRSGFAITEAIHGFEGNMPKPSGSHFRPSPFAHCDGAGFWGKENGCECFTS